MGFHRTDRMVQLDRGLLALRRVLEGREHLAHLPVPCVLLVHGFAEIRGPVLEHQSWYRLLFLLSALLHSFLENLGPPQYRRIRAQKIAAKGLINICAVS